MKRLLIEAEKCTGCRYCEMVCSFKHTKKFSPRLSRVSVLKRDELGFDYPVFCHQCDPCTSVAACPEKALTRTGPGVIRLIEDSCNGCGLCAEACIHEAVKFDADNKPIFCDLCSGEPACVRRCPTGALIFRDYDGEFSKPEKVLIKVLRRWGLSG